MSPTGAIKTLRMVQIGKEATKGTAVPATAILLAEADVDLSGYEMYRNPQPFGTFAKSAGPTAVLKKDVEVALKAEGVSYELLAWFLALTLDQPTTTGAGPYVHTFDPGLAAIWDPHSATLEGRHSDGTNHEDLEYEYFTGRTLRLKGERNGTLQAEVDGFARQATDEAITSLSLPATITPITIAEAKYYMNDTWALADVHAPVAGIVSNQITAFDLEVDCGQEPWHGIDGALTFSEAVEKEKDFRLNVTCKYNPDTASEGVAAERVHAAAGDLRFVTIAFSGPGNMLLDITLAGKHENAEISPPSRDDDGLDMGEYTIVGHYDPTGAKLVKAVLTNDSTLAL